MDAPTPADPITDEWVMHHFDHLAPEFAHNLHPTLARARAMCPVAHSDQHDGFWVVTRYQDVLRVAQDWEAFSSELGVTVPAPEQQFRILPEGIDPPEQRLFKRLINVHFTPAKVAPWEEPTRQLVNQLIDGFIERGECDFMAEFARPFPGLAFFDLVLHAPADDLEKLNRWATLSSLPHLPESGEALLNMAGWIAEFVERRRAADRRDDVVDAIMHASIDGAPIEPGDVIGTIQLLVLGGLETTAGVLGAAMLRLCEHPEILAQLRAKPELIPDAVEELLRLDGSFVCIGRTARHDAEIDGRQIKAGERVLIYWASANRDEHEFADPDTFDLDRPQNRHMAFGVGPHRCVGSNLARMNLRVALDAIVRRFAEIKLQPDAVIDFHSSFNRAPLSVPITFTAAPASVSTGPLLPTEG